MNSYSLTVYDAERGIFFKTIQYAQNPSEAYNKAKQVLKPNRYSFPSLSALVSAAYKEFCKK